MDKHERRALQLERRADLLDKVPSEKKTLSDKKWRPSHFASINPRSATYVREDAPLKERLGYPIAGNAAGAAIAGPVGQMAGASIGRSRNLSRDYVRAYNKRSGRPAESFTGVGLDGFYDYPSSDKLRAKAAKQRSKIKKSVGFMSAFGVTH